MRLTSADIFGVADLGLTEEESAVGQVTCTRLGKTDIVLDEEDVVLVGVQSFHFSLILFLLSGKTKLNSNIINARPVTLKSN